MASPNCIRVLAVAALAGTTLWLAIRFHAHKVIANERDHMLNELVRIEEAKADADTAGASLEALIRTRAALLSEELANLAQKEIASQEVHSDSEMVPTSDVEESFRWDDSSDTARLSKKFLNSLNLRPLVIDPSGRYIVDSLTATFLSLKPEEAHQVHEALDRLTVKHRAIERELLTVTADVSKPKFAWVKNGNPSILLTFAIPAFPSEGAQLQTQFTSDLDNAIGNARAEMLMYLASAQLRSEYGNFGQEERLLTVWENIIDEGATLSVGRIEETSGGHHASSIFQFQITGSRQGAPPPLPAGWNQLLEGLYSVGQNLEMSGQQ